MKPQVKIIEPQSESELKPVNISKEEEEKLLWKYFNQRPELTGSESPQELARRNHEDKFKPKGETPKTINGDHYSDVNFSKIETPIGDIEIKVSINSTMPIPKK